MLDIKLDREERFNQINVDIHEIESRLFLLFPECSEDDRIKLKHFLFLCAQIKANNKLSISGL